MDKDFFYSKIEAVQKQLMTHYQGSNPSSASKGRERETFINEYLKKVLPNTFRFGDGEIIDNTKFSTGQLDIVIENSLFPSLSSISGTPRLYLAESVGAVIEVKSDLVSEWNEVLKTVDKVRKIKKEYSGNIFLGCDDFTKTIPFFAVGYKGWQKEETVREKLKNSGVDGILIIDPGIFIASNLFNLSKKYNGAWALWGLITCLSESLNAIKIVNADLEKYVNVDFTK